MRSGPAQAAHSRPDRDLDVDRHHQRGRAAIDGDGRRYHAINRCELWQLACPHRLPSAREQVERTEPLDPHTPLRYADRRNGANPPWDETDP